MAITPTYPGVYIDEYAPAAPIEGVSTSVAAFIGIAQSGPAGEPTLVTSLDAFTETFGGPQLDSTPYFLPLAVAGFFGNGGTTAYILRVSSAVAAHADLKSRDAVPVDLAIVKAKRDGVAGNGGAVKVTDSSALATAIAAAGAPGTTLSVHRGDTAVTAVDATRRLLNVAVADSSKFQAGDTVVLSRGATRSGRVGVAGVDPGIVRLAAAADAAPAAGEWTSVTTANLAVGDTVVRLDVPAGLSLRAAVAGGSVVMISDGVGVAAWGVASSVGADSITLAAPLARNFNLSVPTTVATAEFDLEITDPAGVKTNYAGLSTTPTHPRWWGNFVDDPYAVIDRTDALPAGDPRPAAATTAMAGATADVPATSWGNVANQIDDHLALLAPIDDISLVAAPGCTDQAAQQAIVHHCEQMFDRFAVLDAAKSFDLTQVRNQRAALTGTFDKGFAALYYPWITIRDPARNEIVLHPPSGHVAGIYAQTDQSRGVHKAPANVGVAGAIGVESRLTDVDQGLINLEGVNAIRILPGRGIPVVWGARTTAGDRNWQYINVRRLFLYLEESIKIGIRGSVFEPNDLGLWERLKRTLNEFLTRAWGDGALFGETAKDAFFVRIDETLNPPSTRKLGRLYIEIGVQPVYPAEFIIVRIGIWDGGATVAES